MASSMLPAAVGRSSSETPCSPMKVAIVTTIAGRRSEVISRPCNRPKPAVAMRIRISPAASGPASTPSGARNEASTTQSPASGPIERSMAPTSTVASCAHDRNVRMLRNDSMLLMLNGDRKYSFSACVPPRMMRVRTASTTAGK